MKSTETQSVLKVLLLTTSFPLTRISRSGIFLQKMVNHLPDNIQVTVLTPDSTETDTRSPVVGYSVLPFRYAPKQLQQLAHSSGGILAALARNKLLFLLLPPFLCSNLLTCCYAARKGDVLHANWSINGVIAGIAGLFFNKPVITTLRGSDVNLMERSGLMRWLVHFCLRFSDAVVTVSPSLQWELTKRFPQYSTKVRVICNGIDQAFFDAGKQAARLHKEILSEAREHDSVLVRFVYVGNLVAGKGVDVILQAAASLPEDNWSLAIIGDGPERKALEDFCQEQGMEGKVTFHGSAPPDEVPLLMRGADIFVFASFAEGRPNVVLEAMATGLPVIAGAIPAVLDLIEDKKQGLLFPPGDVRALAEHMLLLINDPAMRQRLGSGAKEYLASAGLSWPESAREYARLYTEVIEKN